MSTSELPGFDIIGKIGKGGMAEVWKARQRSLDRLVAIKILTNQSLPDEEARARFRTESTAAAKVNHPGIVQVFDAGEQNGVPYYVMEYVEGKTLGDLLEQNGRLPEDNALIIAECIAMALGHAWDKARIVHCDIKPDNILVARDGTIKIADLGLAQVFGTRPGEADSDMVLGTPNYTSPEQAEGHADLDCRSDIYSLGAMLYHLVTGQLPFSGSRGSSAMDMHISEFLADPMDLRPELHAATAWLIEKMMIKDRNARHQTWGEALADVKAVQKGKMPSAPLPEPGQSTVRRSATRTVPAATNYMAEKKKIIAAPEPARRKIVVAKDDLPAATFGASYAPSISSALAATVTLFFCVAAAYGYIFMKVRPGFDAPPPPPKIQVAELPPRTEVVTPPAQPAAAPAPSWQNTIDFGDGPPAGNTSGSASGKKSGTIRWRDPDFLKAAGLYNSALATLAEFQKTRANRNALKTVEANCREAIRLFEQCRSRAPAEVDIESMINDAYHMISDVRHSTILESK